MIRAQFRRGTQAEWTAANPTLLSGEPGYETDTGRFKVGNGSTAWNSLTYSSGVQGEQGAQGAQGGVGPQGYQGSQGQQGYQGNQGNQGNQGSQGNIGPQGYQGAQGEQGAQGAQGGVGPQGYQGSQGQQGYQGNQGNQGLQGSQGNIGPQGYQGYQGPQGPQGSGTAADTVDDFHASQTPTASYCSVATSTGVLNNGWLNDSIRGYEHPIDPVAYYTGHSNTNYPISVGEVCKVTFSSAQTVPLRIATSSGQIFDVGIYTTNTGGTSGGGNGHIYLEPNDTTYSNAFVYNEYQRSTSSASNSSETNDHFRLGYAFGSSRCELINFAGYKCAKGMYDIYGIASSWPFMCIFDTVWQNTTTAWSSLGTIHFAQNSTGFILIRRIV